MPHALLQAICLCQNASTSMSSAGEVWDRDGKAARIEELAASMFEEGNISQMDCWQAHQWIMGNLE